MPVDSTTMTRYDQTGVREQLSDRIYDVSPMDTPVMTAIGRGEKATNTYVEWQTDGVRDPKVNKNLDGADAVFATRTPTVKPGNHCQIFSDALQVSGRADAVKTAGRRQEMLYQIKQSSKAIKRDIEMAVTGNYASDDGSRSTAPALGGLESWYTTNVSRGTGGTSGGFSTGTKQTVAATDATASYVRTFTEARMKAVIRSVWNNSDEGCCPLINVGSFVKEQSSSMTGIATPQQQYPMGPKSSKALAIIGAADIYVSNFGKHRIVANRWSRARTAHFVNPEYAALRYLRGFHVGKLAKNGDAERRQLIADLTLQVSNEKAHGVLADLKTS